MTFDEAIKELSRGKKISCPIVASAGFIVMAKGDMLRVDTYEYEVKLARFTFAEITSTNWELVPEQYEPQENADTSGT